VLRSSFTQPTRPDRSGIAVRSGVGCGKATAIRTDSRKTHNDESVITGLS